MAIYLSIASQLRDEIRREYESGDLLPSEKKLATRFQVNRHTVRRAIDELVQDGMIQRFQGLGNQVTQPTIDYSLHDQSCFTFNLSRAGKSLATKVLGSSEDVLPQKVIQRLQITPSSKAVTVRTCRYMDDDPVTLIRHHLFGVSKDVISQYKAGSLHAFLREHYQYQAKRGITRLKARMPTFDECQQLEIGRGIPVMEIHSQYYLVGSDTLMEYSISVSRSDIFEYSVEP